MLDRLPLEKPLLLGFEEAFVEGKHRPIVFRARGVGLKVAECGAHGVAELGLQSAKLDLRLVNGQLGGAHLRPTADPSAEGDAELHSRGPRWETAAAELGPRPVGGVGQTIVAVGAFEIKLRQALIFCHFVANHRLVQLLFLNGVVGVQLEQSAPTLGV